MKSEASTTARLFVPLSAEPFRWFAEGQKQWELRKYGRQYSERHIKVGREVELRRGYNSSRSLWGIVAQTMRAANLRNFFDHIDYREVVPTASSKDEAIKIAESILGIPSDADNPVFGFKVEIAA